MWDYIDNRAADDCRLLQSLCDDCETFRVPPLMSKKTIRIPDEDGGGGVAETTTARAGH